jgi:subtilase family serine protease
VTFSVYASADQTFDAGDTALASVTRFLKRMKMGKSKGVGAKFMYPADIGNGNYYLLVQADTANGVAESNETNNTGTSPAVASIRQPFTDLQPTLVGKPSRVTAGTEAVVTVALKNNGNVPFKAGTPIAVVLSSDSTVDGGDRVLTTVTPTVSIKNGKTKSVKLKVPLPADLAPGPYFVGVNVDPANVLAESDEANNAGASIGFTSI